MSHTEATADANPLAEVGRYARLGDANERALVVLAMGIGCWMFREGEMHVLCVEEKYHARVVREISLFEKEQASWRRQFLREAEAAGANLSLYIFVALMSCFYLVQRSEETRWLECGVASSAAIISRGQWWRTITALTLHADSAHLIANLVVGAVFASALTQLMRTGLAWAVILASGVIGNLLNAWFYRAVPHDAIGASTAVFGALGALVAAQVVARLFERRHFSRTEILLPLGAGLALLAYLGTNGERTDFMAHLWGFASGLLLGGLVGIFRLNERIPSWMQYLLAAGTPVALLLAWRVALR
jgi:membrane associated rhomboid family serine protease